MECRLKIIIIFLLLNFGFLTAFAGTAETKTVSVNKSKILEVKPLFIKVSDVPESSITLSTELKDIGELLQENNETLQMHKEIKPYCDSISTILEGKNYKSIAKQDTRDLQKMQSELAIYTKHLQDWEVSLKEKIELYDTNREVLEKHSLVWNETYNNALSQKAPKSILENIVSVKKEIKHLSQKVKKQYDKTLTYIQMVKTNILTLKETDETLKKAETVAKSQVFNQNEASLVELLSTNELSLKTYVTSIVNSIKEKSNEITLYFNAEIGFLINYLAAIFVLFVFIIYFNYLRRHRKLLIHKESIKNNSFLFLLKPLSTFLLLSVLLSVEMFIGRPKSVLELQLIILIIPIIRIVQTVIDKELNKYIYTFFTLYLLWSINLNAVDSDLGNRIVTLLLNISLLVFIGTLYLKKILLQINNHPITRLGHNIVAIYGVMLSVSVVANLYGSTLLSSRLLDGIFTTIYASMVFYSVYTIFSGYVVIILRRRISTASYRMDKYSHNIEKNIKLLIKIWMFLWLMLIVVKQLGVYTYLIEYKNEILSFSWNISDTTISIQSIFDFILIVFGTWALSRLTRTILEVEVFARFKLPRGAPTAITTVLNYTILITGTIIAFSSLGVSPQQFALIFGALGVGIGFGLRNIIANFVSGIIMVFERPIQIGDTIEVDKTMGSVQSIGARSSTVKTFDGSEVIIPNADFIAKEITNWTLSDEYRRKIVEFKVDLESDVDLILKIMEDVALAHKDVLRDPEPLATFKGFNEYYLEFKLYFWLSENLIVAQSDVAIGIYRALKEAGIKMPVQKTQLERSREVFE